MGLFSVDFQDVPNRGVIAQGGLKFRATVEYLNSYFDPVLQYVSLNDLIGEAVFWFLMPSTIAIWAFPFFLYFNGLPSALVWTLGVHLVAEATHLLVYIKPLNYLVFVLGNKILQGVVYLTVAVVCAVTGHISWTAALIGVYLAYALGLADLCVGILAFPVNRFVGLPTSDQLLRLIGWHYGRKHGQDPLNWKMCGKEDGQGQQPTPPYSVNRGGSPQG